MEKDLSHLRKNYNLNELRKKDIAQNPMEQFQLWFVQAQQSDTQRESNAMTISTISSDGFPKNRVVLLKKYTHEGFIFYTNYLSEKGQNIEANPKVCLSFFWGDLERQIIIKGIAEKLSKNLNDGYFESRPRGSQLGAWVSEQSQTIPSREWLENRLISFEKKYENQPITRPDHWGGYLIKPYSMEFWQGRPNRLHDRICYTLTDDFDWRIERLSP